MYQSLIKKYPDHRIKLMRKHYHGSHGGMIKLNYCSAMRDVILALHNPNYISWVTSNSGLTTQISYGRYTVSTLPFCTLYNWITNAQLKYREDYNGFKIYFEKFDELTEFADWAIRMQSEHNLSNWIHSIGGVDETLVTGQVTLRNASYKDYRYKVMLKSMHHSDKIDWSRVETTLNQFSDSIRVTKSVRDFISRKHTYKYWLSTAYFYAKDSESITYFSLVFPDLVKKIYEINYLPNQKKIKNDQSGSN